eukprot:327368-Prymnesium_polylepis.1
MSRTRSADENSKTVPGFRGELAWSVDRGVGLYRKAKATTIHITGPHRMKRSPLRDESARADGPAKPSL